MMKGELEFKCDYPECGAHVIWPLGEVLPGTQMTLKPPPGWNYQNDYEFEMTFIYCPLHSMEEIGQHYKTELAKARAAESNEDKMNRGG